MSDEELLGKLLALILERAGREGRSMKAGGRE